MNKSVILAMLVILALVFVACPSTPATTPPTTPSSTTTPPTTLPPTTTPPTTLPPTTPTGPSVTIDLIAHDIAFNLSTITVPAGAAVTVKFTNEDSGIPHNFAVYETSAAQHAIFQGQVITGPSSITYHFTVPSTPGDYFFRCDIHPTIMTGTFVVTSS
jgi:plastocyanin